MNHGLNRRCGSRTLNRTRTQSIRKDTMKSMNANLYELTTQFQNAMDALTVDEETGEVIGFEAVDALDAAFEDKAEAYAVVIKTLLAQAQAIHAERENLKEREDAAKRKAESMKNHLALSMAAVGKDKIETAKAALSFRKSTSVNILSDVEIPDDLCKVTIDRKPDKTAIKKALQAGEVVPGAELVENRNLQVK